MDDYCTWKTYPDKPVHDEFLSEVHRMIMKDAIYEGTTRDNKVNLPLRNALSISNLMINILLIKEII